MRTALLLASLVLAPAVAIADPVSEARHFFERGNEKLAPALRMGPGRARDGAIRAALAEYLESVRIVRSKNALFNVGLCYEELRELDSAYGYYSEYLGLELTADERAEVERRRARIEPRVALVEVVTEPPGASVFVDRRDLASRGRTPVKLAVRPGERRLLLELEGHDGVERTVEAQVGRTERVAATLTSRPMIVEVTSDPPGAEVRVGSGGAEPAGTTPTRLELPAGSVRLFLSRPGFDPVEETARGGPGETVQVRVALGAIPSPGMLRIGANVRGARVEVDGESWGEVTDTAHGLRPGRHEVVVSRAGYRPARSAVVVNEGLTTEVSAVLQPEDPGRRLGAWPTVALVGGAVSAAIGGLVGIAAVSKQNDLDDAREDWRDAGDDAERAEIDRRAHDIADEIDSLNKTADAFFIAGGVLGLVWVGLLVLDGPAEAEDSTIRITAGPGGLVATGVLP